MRTYSFRYFPTLVHVDRVERRFNIFGRHFLHSSHSWIQFLDVNKAKTTIQQKAKRDMGYSWKMLLPEYFWSMSNHKPPRHRYPSIVSTLCLQSLASTPERWRFTQFYDKVKSESRLPWIVLCLGLCPHFLPTGWRSAQAESGIAELSQNLILEPKSIYALRLVKLGCQELHSYLEGPK